MKSLKSLPARERGLKPALSVRPPLNAESLPARERGLKRISHAVCCRICPVAPRAGAWIETRHPIDRCTLADVAPRAGAWIETCEISSLPARPPSLPARERGLKRFSGLILVPFFQVAPRAGAWIETSAVHRASRVDLSLPARERGLKQNKREEID